MLSKHRPRTLGANAPLDEFSKLSAIFRSRLQSERVHFATLSAALAGAEETPRRVFEDLQFRAHRLKGTAAIFEFSDISAAAAALERAAAAAAVTRADNTDAAVWAALVGLVNVLGEFDDPDAGGMAESA